MNNSYHKKICTYKFIASLFSIANKWKQPKCPSTDEWINKMWYIRECVSVCVCAKSLQSCLTLWTLWTIVHQTFLSMGFSRQEYWSGLPFPSPGDLSDPGIEPGAPALQAGSLPTELLGKPKIVNIHTHTHTHFADSLYCTAETNTKL